MASSTKYCVCVTSQGEPLCAPMGHLFLGRALFYIDLLNTHVVTYMEPGTWPHYVYTLWSLCTRGKMVRIFFSKFLFSPKFVKISIFFSFFLKSADYQPIREKIC